ncbi:putative FAD-binding oxidoreductase [Hypoxylon sp. EC38]|nr:putative FAD-binding oxidoreductase [Hypoxylon sp. EC38]
MRVITPFVVFGASCLTLAQLVSAFSENTGIVCEQLKQSFTTDVFEPNETEYPVLRTKNWSQTAWRVPACIVQPDNAAELQSVVKTLVNTNTSFAIRSGGHSPSPWAANIDGGVLIDMSNFNIVEYDSSNNVAIVGSGQTWADVYPRLDQHDVTIVGGRIVLADGSLINANSKSHPDLFWALKGGGNNFGIVTAFTFSTYPIKEVWAGVKGYSLEDLPTLFSAMLEYQSVAVKDPYANLDLQGFVTNASVGIALSLVYLKPVENPPAFAPFYGINTTSDSTALTTLTEFLTGQGPASFPRRADWFATSFLPSESIYSSLTGIMTTSPGFKQVQSVTAGTVAFGMQPISTSVIEAGNARGGNALGLKAVNQTWYVIDAGWWWEDDDTIVHEGTRDMIDQIEAESKAANDYVPYIFMNDASWDQPVIEHYGDANVRKLKEVQLRYDPNLVFQKLVPGGFKLP